MKEPIVIYLCVAAREIAHPELKAVYDDEFIAQAWVDGYEAGTYCRAAYMAVDSNEGPINFYDWWESIDWSED